MSIFKFSISIIALAVAVVAEDGSVTRPPPPDSTPAPCPSTCVPKLCMGDATMNGAVTLLTYVCPEGTTTTTTVYTTITVDPTPSDAGGSPVVIPSVPASSDPASSEPTTATTITSESTIFITKTVKRVSSTPTPTTAPPMTSTLTLSLASFPSPSSNISWISTLPTFTIPVSVSYGTPSGTEATSSFPTLILTMNGSPSGISWTSHPSVGTGSYTPTGTGDAGPTAYPVGGFRTQRRGVGGV